MFAKVSFLSKQGTIKTCLFCLWITLASAMDKLKLFCFSYKIENVLKLMILV